MEQQLPATRSERKIAQLVQNQEVRPGEHLRHLSLAIRLGFRNQPIHQIDNIEEPTAAAVPNPAPGQADREMRLAGPGSADQGRVALPTCCKGL